jgi:glycerol-3-phosphate acyltransferase PlsY
MNPLLSIGITLIVGYLIGAISNAVIVSKAHGVDIFKVGSGNPGATNVKRSVGKFAGDLTFILDLLKGFLVTLWPLLPGVPVEVFGVDPVYLSLAGLAGALIGHSFSIYIGFRGGKGVATTIGGLLALMPIIVIIGLVVWLIVFYSSRYVSLASICFALSMPVSVGVFMALGVHVWRPYSLVHLIVGLVIAVLIVVRHISNIQRLMQGTENKFERKKSDPPEGTTASK